MDDIRSAPCAVRRFVIRGCQHTHESVITQELVKLRGASTLGSIGDACVEVAAALRSLDIFDSADLLCDAAPARASDGLPQADIVVSVREKKRLASASTGVHTQGSEGSLDGSLRVRNAFGRAERVELQAEMGQHKSNTFRLHASKPRLFGADASLSAEVIKQSVSHLKRSSHVEKLRGGRVACVVGQPEGQWGSHELAYELQLRDICKVPSSSTVRSVPAAKGSGPGSGPSGGTEGTEWWGAVSAEATPLSTAPVTVTPSAGASWAVLQQRGLSLKSALRHTYSLSRLGEASEAGGHLYLPHSLNLLHPPCSSCSPCSPCSSCSLCSSCSSCSSCSPCMLTMLIMLTILTARLWQAGSLAAAT